MWTIVCPIIFTMFSMQIVHYVDKKVVHKSVILKCQLYRLFLYCAKYVNYVDKMSSNVFQSVILSFCPIILTMFRRKIVHYLGKKVKTLKDFFLYISDKFGFGSVTLQLREIHWIKNIWTLQYLSSYDQGLR